MKIWTSYEEAVETFLRSREPKVIVRGVSVLALLCVILLLLVLFT